MLELIFQGFIEWLYGLIMECWEYFSSALLDIAGMDFAYLRQRMPVIDDIMQLMLALGWALLIGNLVFQAVRAMLSGIGFDGEDPKLLFARTFVFAFLLLASPQICALCLDMTSTAMDIMQLPQAAEIRFADEASFPGLASSWLLVIVCGIIVILQSLKLICELAERYFILATLTVTAPLAFGVGGSRSTSDIFTGWCRMYGSMCLLMVLSAVFVKMLLSILSFYPSGLDVLPWMVLVIAVVKVAKKADSIITRIGLNPAITGEPLGRSLPGVLTYTVMRMATASILKAVGDLGGGHKSGRMFFASHAGGTKNSAFFTGTVGAGRRGGGQNCSSQRTADRVFERSESSERTGQESFSEHGFGKAASPRFGSVGESRRSFVPPNMRHTPYPDGGRRSPAGGSGSTKHTSDMHSTYAEHIEHSSLRRDFAGTGTQSSEKAAPRSARGTGFSALSGRTEARSADFSAVRSTQRMRTSDSAHTLHHTEHDAGILRAPAGTSSDGAPRRENAPMKSAAQVQDARPARGGAHIASRPLRQGEAGSSKAMDKPHAAPRQQEARFTAPPGAPAKGAAEPRRGGKFGKGETGHGRRK